MPGDGIVNEAVPPVFVVAEPTPEMLTVAPGRGDPLQPVTAIVTLHGVPAQQHPGSWFVRPIMCSSARSH